MFFAPRLSKSKGHLQKQATKVLDRGQVEIDNRHMVKPSHTLRFSGRSDHRQKVRPARFSCQVSREVRSKRPSRDLAGVFPG